MTPVRTKNSNFVYRGPTIDIGDAWVQRMPREHAVFLVWELTDDERNEIALGGNLKMGIYYMEPIPPVSLGVTSEEIIDRNSPPVTETNPFSG